MVAQFVTWAEEGHDTSVVTCGSDEVIFTCNAAIAPQGFVNLLQCVVSTIGYQAATQTYHERLPAIQLGRVLETRSGGGVYLVAVLLKGMLPLQVSVEAIGCECLLLSVAIWIGV